MNNLAEAISEVADHFFPELNKWMREIKDHRHPQLITYQQETLLWSGLIMYLTRRGARRQIGIEMRGGNCVEGLKELSGQKGLTEAPHGDTLEYFIQKSDIEDFENLDKKMIQRLVRMRVLEGARLQGKYLIPIDGVHISTFDYPHCQNCIKRKHKNGTIQWQHYKVQASLITPNGLCLPMVSEWIENEEFYDKQDCEINAAKRLLKKLRRMYPKLKMCVLMDSLYANEPMFEAIEESRMEWIVVFKKGTMPEVYKWIKEKRTVHGQGNQIDTISHKEIKSRKNREHQQRVEREILTGGTRLQKVERLYTWISAVRHWQKERKYNLLSCKETVDGNVKCEYTWLVSAGIRVDELTVKKVAQAGRCRWKIENEGNNVQKNGGYNLEHLYSRDEVSMKIWIILLDISHIISQLMEKGISKLKEIYGSSQNIAKRMYEHLRYCVFKKSERRQRQIRLFQHDVNFGWDTS